jgi:hypothetical protein
MNTFEFDDVIKTARVIVNPEQAAAQLTAKDAEILRLTTAVHDKDMEIIRMTSIAENERLYLEAALPRIHQSEANDEFCRTVRTWLEGMHL